MPLAAYPGGGADVRRVDVEEHDRPARLVHDAVSPPRRRTVERSRRYAHDSIRDDEAGFALDDEERVHLVVVLVRPDPRPRRLDGEAERRDLPEFALDDVHAVLADELFAAIGGRDDDVRERPSPVRG